MAGRIARRADAPGHRRIEKKLEELESLDYTKSVTVAGETTVFVYLRDTTKAATSSRPGSGSAT